MTCVYCPHEIKNGDMFWDLRCGKHMAHASHDTTRCLVCTPMTGAAVTTQPVGQPAAVATSAAVTPSSVNIGRAEQEARARRLANNAVRRSEPLKPYEASASTVGSWFGSILSVAARVAEASVPDDESSNPTVLLDAGVPLKVLVSKHGWDITELINDPPGVTIGDFFRNRYTIGEMCEAFSSRMNPAEGMAVLYALGMTDEFLTAMPKQSQVSIMRAKLGLNPETLVKYLEYKFVPGRWTIPQMLEVGLTMPMVMELGLRTAEDWAQLRETARTTSELQQFGVTPFLEAQMIRPVMQTALTSTEQYVPPSGFPTPILNAAQPQTAPAYVPIMPVQWPPSSSTTVPSTHKAAPTNKWGSRLPLDVMTPTPVVPVVQHLPPVPIQTEWNTRPDMTPKLVDRTAAPPPLFLLPQHQTSKPVKYALK
jgi:hypothetical protein